MRRGESQVIDDFRRELERIVEEFVLNNGIEIFGELSIEVVDIDSPALIKGNTVYVNSIVSEFPKYVQKYVIAHELAHLVIKRHTKKFWGIVKQIYPQYEKGKKELSRRYNNF